MQGLSTIDLIVPCNLSSLTKLRFSSVRFGIRFSGFTFAINGYTVFRCSLPETDCRTRKRSLLNRKIHDNTTSRKIHAIHDYSWILWIFHQFLWTLWISMTHAHLALPLHAAKQTSET